MSNWENFYIEDAPLQSLPPSLPSRLLKIPEANKLARALRNGRTVSDLAVRYGVAPRVLVRRLTENGWNPKDGTWMGKSTTKGAPLSQRGQGPGSSQHHVGGGDNPNVVPLTARPIRERPKFTGYVWPNMPATPTATPRPRPRTMQRRSNPNEGRRKLTATMRQEIARRYRDNLEASTALAKEYGVNQRTIRKALTEQGVILRNRSEAGYLRWSAQYAAQQDGNGAA